MELRNFLKGNKGEQKIEYRFIADLTPHTENESIYGKDEDVSDLVEKIKKSKRVDTLTITDKNIIISGHRRWKACKVIGIDEVPVQVEVYENKEDELEALVLSNASREKTTEQKTREGMVLEEVEKFRAKLRMTLTQNNDSAKELAARDEPSHADIGRTRDQVAKKVGFKSGRQYERTRNVVNKIDKLKEQGNADDAELLTDILNKAPSTAEEFISRVDIETLDSNTKSKIKSGEKSAYKVVTEEKEKIKPKLPPSKTDAPIPKSELEAVVAEYNAISRGEIPMVDFTVAANVVLDGARNMIDCFNRQMTQLTCYEIEIKRMSDEEYQILQNTMLEFEEEYQKNKEILMRR